MLETIKSTRQFQAYRQLIPNFVVSNFYNQSTFFLTDALALKKNILHLFELDQTAYGLVAKC